MLGTRSISTAGKATPGVSARPRSRWVRQGLVGITDSLPAGDEEGYSRASSGRIFINADLSAVIIPCSLIQQVAGIRVSQHMRALTAITTCPPAQQQSRQIRSSKVVRTSSPEQAPARVDGRPK